MSSQTSLVAQQTRLHMWAEQIRESRNRPEGMMLKTWCEQNGLTKANYYYRLRRVRQACLEYVQPAEPAFVELPTVSSPCVAPELPLSKTEASNHTAAIIKGHNGLTIEICDQASDVFLKNLLEVLIHA